MMPVVSTKLSVPRPVAAPIERWFAAPFLERLLQCPLGLVIGGPGYGKSTFLSTLAQREPRTGWYSLELSDRDPVVFLAHLMAAITPGVEKDEAGKMARIGQSFLRQVAERPEEALAKLVNHLSGCVSRDYVVVLDDFQAVDDAQEIVIMVSYLLLHLPPRLHFVIGSRRVPPFPFLSKWSLSGTVVELGEQELRFTIEEAAALSRETWGLSLRPRLLRRLMEYVEGWPIGLQSVLRLFVYRTAGNGADTDEAFDCWLGRLGRPAEEGELDLAGSGMGQLASRLALFRYFSDEVLDRLDLDLKSFLLRTSVLEALSVEVCDAILEIGNSREYLQLILNGRLFLTQVDSEWFRYHSLFREYLCHVLKSERPSDFHALHQRAGEYFRTAGAYETAIHHFLAIGEWSSAAQCLEWAAPSLVRAGSWGTLSSLSRRLPPEVLARFPGIMLSQGKTLELRGFWKSALEWYSRAEEAFVGRGDHVSLAEIATRRGHIAAWFCSDPDAARSHYQHAADLAVKQRDPSGAELLSSVALSVLSTGDVGRAEELFLDARRIFATCRDSYGEAVALISPGSWINFVRGRFPEALELLDRAAELLGEGTNRAVEAELNVCRSVNLLHLCRFDEAKEAAQAALEHDAGLGESCTFSWAHMVLGYVLMEQREPDYEAALEHLRLAHENAKIMGDRRVTITILNGFLRLAHRLGDEEGVAQALRDCAEQLQVSTDKWQVAYSLANSGAVHAVTEPLRSQEELLRARDLFAEYDDRFNLAFVDFWLSYLDVARGENASSPRLTSWIRIVDETGYHSVLLGYPKVARRLLAVAAEQGIEPAAVRRLRLVIEGPEERAQGSAKDEASRGIRLTCLGRFAVHVDGRAVPESAWGGKRTKDLLRYLALNYPQPCSVEQVIEALWPGLPPAAAARGLYKTAYRLRVALDPAREHDREAFFAIRQGMISWNAKVETDVQDFLGLVRRARLSAASTNGDPNGSLGEACTLYQQAESLYVGDLLPDNLYDDWAAAPREELRLAYLSVLESLGDLYMRDERLAAAAESYRRALLLYPDLEPVHVKLIRCLLKAGHAAQAIEQYRSCCRTLRETLGVDPSPETQSIARQLFQHPVTA